MTEEQGCIFIDESPGAQKELLALGIGRMKEFDRAEAGEPFGAYFSSLFGILVARAEGTETPAYTLPEDPLLSFWMQEALLPLPENEEKRTGRLLSLCETSLLLLFTLCGEPDSREQAEKDIFYSYLSDYADEFVTEYVRSGGNFHSLVTDFIFERTPENSRQMSYFLGDRLKAKMEDALKKAKKEYPAEFAAMKDRIGEAEPFAEAFTGHQKNVLESFLKKAGLLFLLLSLLCTLAAGCGRKKEEPEETTAPVRSLSEEYPGLCEVRDSDGTLTDIFGIMHALVLDVQPGEKSGLYVYTLRDNSDPDNAWSVESQYVGDIVAEVTKGAPVAVLFSGNIVDDPDNVEFVAILEDRNYKIKSAEGTVITNMMNSFVMRTKTGQELTFQKDNCKVDRDALSTESGATIRVYYAEGDHPDRYPLRVYNETGKIK